MDVVETLTESMRQAVGPQAAAFAIAAVGINLQFGYTGLLNFGQVAFLLAGAYGLGITVDAGGSFWLGLAVAIASAVLLAFLLGIPTLRLRADYLAIVTVATGEILRLLVGSAWGGDNLGTGGPQGIKDVTEAFNDLNPIPDGSFGFSSFRFDSQTLWVTLVGWLLALLATLLVRQLVRSPWGRVLRSIREDEDAARSLGKNVFAYKMQSLALGGVMGALGGIIITLNFTSVIPDYFIPTVTFFAYAVVILGGAGSVWGPLLGSVIFWFVIQFSESSLDATVPEDILSSQDLAALRFVLVGLLLMALMVFRPQGMLGKKEELLADG